MADLSQYSDEELRAMLGKSNPSALPVNPAEPITDLNGVLADAALRQDLTPQEYMAKAGGQPLDISTLSDEQLRAELEKFGQKQVAPAQPERLPRQSLLEQLGNSEFSKGINDSVRESAQHGVKNVFKFGSTEPAWQAESALGRFAANAARPFVPLAGLAEIGTAPAFAALKGLVREPVTAVTGSKDAGEAAELAAGLLTPFGAQKIAQKSPQIAQRFENTVLGKFAKDIGTSDIGGGVRAAGTAIEQSGIKAADKARTAFVEDLILPKATSSVREDLVGRTKEVGLNRRKVVELTPQEREVAATVSAIPGVKKSNSLQGNANAIQAANRAEADNLISALKKNDVDISSETLATEFGAVRERLANNPYLSGADASKAADSVMEAAMKVMAKYPQTASGLLAARKELDQVILSQKPNAFTAADSPVTVALRDIRRGINDVVAGAVPEAAVKESLRKQSNLYKAHEAIATKAKDEASTRVGRALQNVEKGVSIKRGLAGLAAAGGLGLTGMAGPAAGLAAGGLVTYGLKKALTSPALRKGTGSSLRKLGESL